jgi:hypothetical protein
VSEFLHDVVAKREQSAPPRYPAQYTPIYRSVFVRTIYHPLVVNHADMLDNIMYWVDSPEYRLLRVIFSSLECEHRWVFDLPRCTSRTYIYKCMLCQQEQTQSMREGREI